eukprot:6186520-Pleurochrysis_carterae.AAC.2
MIQDHVLHRYLRASVASYLARRPELCRVEQPAGVADRFVNAWTYDKCKGGLNMNHMNNTNKVHLHRRRHQGAL